MMISNKTYDALKWVAQILLPSIGTLYFAITNIWGLPYSAQVVGTITSIDAFLGVLLGISSSIMPQSRKIPRNKTDICFISFCKLRKGI